MNYNYIAIEGNIGAGKTTLATRIAHDFNAKLILEEFEDNSFLPKFYQDPDKYAFPLEMSFLADRYQQLKETLSTPDLFKNFTISDYFIDKSLIFSRKTLKKDEYQLYSKLFNIIISTLPKPDLIVYLYMDIENLQSNIKKRGRDYEQQISDDYLATIQGSYLEYLSKLNTTRVLIIDRNDLELLDNNIDYKKLMDLIFKEYPIGIHRLRI